MIDSVSIVLCNTNNNVGDDKMSSRTSMDGDMCERTNCNDYRMTESGTSGRIGSKVNATDQTESNSHTSHNKNNNNNRTNACNNIQMDPSVETAINVAVTENSESSCGGLEQNDVTSLTMLSSASSHGAISVDGIESNSVKCLPMTTTTNPSPIELSPCRAMATTTVSDCHSDDDFDEIQKLFENKPLAIEKWLRERAPHDVLSKMHAATECVRTPKSPKLRTSSVTSDLFQQWLATSPVQVCVYCSFSLFTLSVQYMMFDI